MGKTNPTYRSVLERLANEEWGEYRRMLRRRDQLLYDDLWKKARNHADAANAANPRPMDGALFSMLLAQQREIEQVIMIAGTGEMDKRTIFSGHLDGRYVVVPVDVIEEKWDRPDYGDDLNVRDLEVIGRGPGRTGRVLRSDVDPGRRTGRSARGPWGVRPSADSVRARVANRSVLIC